MARSSNAILGNLISHRDSRDTHENVLQSTTDRYKTQSTKLDQTTRLADFENSIKTQLEDALLKAQITALNSGKSAESVTTKDVDNFENDELSSFYKKELTDLVGDVANMSRTQMKVQKKRIEELSKSLANSDAKEKDFLMNQYAQSMEFLENEHERKNKMSARLGEAWEDVSEQYLDIQSLYSGFFNNNPLAMIAFQFGKKMLVDHRQRKKDEKTLIEKDTHEQQMAIKSRQDRERMEAEQAKRNKTLADHKESLNKKEEKEEEKEEYKKDEQDNLDDNCNLCETIEKFSRNPSLPDDSDDKILSDSKSLMVYNKPQEDENVAERVNELQSEKKDRQTQMDYYASTQAWQKSLLKCMCPTNLPKLGKDKKTKDKSGSLLGGLLPTKAIKGIVGTVAGTLGLSTIGSMLGIGTAGATTVAGTGLATAGATTAGATAGAGMGAGALTTAKFLMGPAAAIAGSALAGGIEYGTGGGVGNALGVGGTALSGAAYGAMIGSIVPGIGTAIGATIGGLAGAVAGSAMFSRSDDEKRAELATRELDTVGIIDRNDVLGWEKSELLKPSELENLSINQLKSLVAIDDWSDEDLQLINETLEVKQGYRDQLSQKMKAHLNEGKVGELQNTLDSQGIIDQDRFWPFDDDDILRPEDLKKLSINQLKTLLRSDDYNDADLQLIRETLEIKQGKRDKLSKDSQSRSDTIIKDRKQDERDDVAESTVEDLASQGILDLDYAGTSEIEDVMALKDLSADTLQKVLDFKDWNSDDTKLIEELIKQKKAEKSGKVYKVDQEVQERINDESLKQAEKFNIVDLSDMWGTSDEIKGTLSDLVAQDPETLQALLDRDKMNDDDKKMVENALKIQKGGKIKSDVTKATKATPEDKIKEATDIGYIEKGMFSDSVKDLDSIKTLDQETLQSMSDSGKFDSDSQEMIETAMRHKKGDYNEDERVIDGKKVDKEEYNAYLFHKQRNATHNVKKFMSNNKEITQEQAWNQSNFKDEQIEQYRKRLTPSEQGSGSEAEQKMMDKGNTKSYRRNPETGKFELMGESNPYGDNARNNQESLTGTPSSNPKLGAISEKYESGGRGAGTISTGRGDPGGVSYGTYQLASKTGTLQKYLDQSKYKDQLTGDINSPEFKENWKKLAKENPEFAQDQHDFIKRTHYDPVEAEYRKQTGETGELDAGVADALWSQSVQHSGKGNKKIIANSLKGLDENATSEQKIEALYGSRGDYVSGLSMEAGTKASLQRRYQNEQQDALALSKSSKGQMKRQPYDDPMQEEMAKTADEFYAKDTASFMNAGDAGDAGTSRLTAQGTLQPVEPKSNEVVARIESTNNEIQSKKSKQPPVVVNNSVAQNSSGGGGSGGSSNPSVGSARNNESTLSKVTGGYLLSGMA